MYININIQNSSSQRARFLKALAIILVVLGTASCANNARASSTTPADLGHVKTLENAIAKTEGDQNLSTQLVGKLTSDGSVQVSLEVSGTEESSATSMLEQLKLNVESPVAEQLQTIQVGGIEYISVPAALTSFVPSGIKWISVSYPALISQLAQSKNGAEVLLGLSINPAALAVLLKNGHINSATKSGNFTINGTPTTAYQAQIDFPGSNSNMASQPFSAITAEQLIGKEKATVQLWIDSTGLVRQMEFRLPTAQTSIANKPGTLSFMINYSNTTTSLAITAPPNSVVMPLSAQTLTSVLSSALG